MDNAGTIERSLDAFARGPNEAAQVVVPGSRAIFHRELIIRMTANLRLPAIYPYRYFVTNGGLMAYGPDTLDQFRSAAGYIDRILKGEKAADLQCRTQRQVRACNQPQYREGTQFRNPAHSVGA
jgi:putative ABC transport system substrate-binding protein